MNIVHRLLAALALLVATSGALAQNGIEPYVEYRKRIESAQNISPLDNGLFGEQVSLYNGATTFSVTDIDLPGNNALPVRLTRKFAVELQLQTTTGTFDPLLRGIGNWDIDVPYMAATYRTGGTETLSCNGIYMANPSGEFSRGEIWQGISVNVPGRGTTLALGVPAGTPKPTTGGPYKLTTSERDVFECIPTPTGPGFKMTTSSGLRYYFDVVATRTAARLIKYRSTVSGITVHPRDRTRVYLLASKIEDRFGNTVQFQYDNGHPKKIWSNDGREINLTYLNGRLQSATAHGRTWTYVYSNISSGAYARLWQVIRPDTSKWEYLYSNDLSLFPMSGGLPQQEGCTQEPDAINIALTLTAKHPSGALGIFEFENWRHYRSGVHASVCLATHDHGEWNYDLSVPHYFDVMSIQSKTLSGAGLEPMKWEYKFPLDTLTLWTHSGSTWSYPCTDTEDCPPSKTVTLIHPDETKTVYTFGMRYFDNDGRQLKVETFRDDVDDDGSKIRTETITYMTEAEAAAPPPFFGQYGSVLDAVVFDPASARIRPVTNRTIEQDDASFVWQADSFDTMARPKDVTRSSTVAGSQLRSEQTTYHDDVVKWVLGQVSKVRCTAPVSTLDGGCGISGTDMFERTYHLTYAVPEVTSRFGKVEQTLMWDIKSSVASGQLGTVKSVADGNNQVTTLSRWKRGIPQTIQYPPTPEVPAGASQTAEVTDDGWLDWIEDENGYKTDYDYDAMGRLSGITYPTGDSTAWNTTSLTFEQDPDAIYHSEWKLTVSTGTGNKITYFDALWRPLVTHEFDTADVSGTERFQQFAYDHEGRTIFASYLWTAYPYDKGTRTEYDPLGRVVLIEQDSELSPSLLRTETTYLPGFEVRVKNPRDHETTTRYLAWDEPTQDYPIFMSHPAGAYTHITRDVFGKPTLLRRSNSSNPNVASVALNRIYHYDDHQRLCHSRDPESGVTLMGYDGAGNLTWSASGLPPASPCHATGDDPAINPRKVVRTYDGRNRLGSLTFPSADPRGNQTWTYTPDGLPATVTTANTISGGGLVTNTYAYNKRRLLTAETMTRNLSVMRPAWSTTRTAPSSSSPTATASSTR